MSTSVNTTTGQWNTAAIRRAMRVLCAHPPDVHNPQQSARDLRLVQDILHRRGIPASVYGVPGLMPLVVAGNGPLLLITYVDDQVPPSRANVDDVPNVSASLAVGDGVKRRAGLLAAISPVVSGQLSPDDVTLVVEADRHLGSVALHSWLSSSEHSFDSALWESVDLPVPTPAVFQSATGIITLKVTLESSSRDIESFYAGVLPDIGHQLVDALAGLKSRDSEVLVPGFYDDIDIPNSEALARFQKIHEGVHRWISTRVESSSAEMEMSAAHQTLGVFCAPSIAIRSISIPDSQPYIPARADAVVEAQLMPGQDAHAVLQKIVDHLRHRVPRALIEPLQVRQPYGGPHRDTSEWDSLATVYPTAPGGSPAGALDRLGIPSVGFATVSREPDQTPEHVTIRSVEDAAVFVLSLCHRSMSVWGSDR
jgi:acetylornithine deacetylase/succinyl-diaminopimelate desuccinylase-like protein